MAVICSTIHLFPAIVPGCTRILTPYIGGLLIKELVEFDELGMNNADIVLPNLHKLF
jgi:hypothetical protein